MAKSKLSRLGLRYMTFKPSVSASGTRLSLYIGTPSETPPNHPSGAGSDDLDGVGAVWAVSGVDTHTITIQPASPTRSSRCVRSAINDIGQEGATSLPRCGRPDSSTSLKLAAGHRW